jgi:hypothetical protein
MASYSKHLLCLANSQKMSGRCVAGKEIVGGQYGGWVRPVSGREHQEISDTERRYADGSSAGLLDVLTITFAEPVPHGFQSENHRIDASQRWTHAGKATWEHVLNALDNVTGPLWVNVGSSSYGINDQIPESTASTLQTSLVLIRPTNLQIKVGSEGFFWRKRRARANFSLNGLPYSLSLTDVLMRQTYLAKPDGLYPVADAVLCVSLGEPFRGYVYKLAAALITPERVNLNDA